jgi:PTH1 family peptidyl-tRNA hydrolase
LFEGSLIVGLGNPGKLYEKTRHNVGFLVLRHLAAQHGFQFKNSSLTKGMTAEGHIQGKVCLFLLPLTFMNHSGVAVKQFLTNHPTPLRHLLVVCDDMDLRFGQLRIRPKGTSGGHKGLDSIIEQLGTGEFARLRLGVGRPAKKDSAVDFVLGGFSRQEEKELESVIHKAAHCCAVWLIEGTTRAMDQFNKRKQEDDDDKQV